jgi:hypothetical protein
LKNGLAKETSFGSTPQEPNSMHQIHGFVEFRQLEEWYGVVDVGSLLLPSLQLSERVLECARSHGTLYVPDDASIAFTERYSLVREHVMCAGFLSYNQALALLDQKVAGAQADGDSVLQDTLFDTLFDLCKVLMSRFGVDSVRMVFYID